MIQRPFGGQDFMRGEEQQGIDNPVPRLESKPLDRFGTQPVDDANATIRNPTYCVNIGWFRI